MPKLDQFSPVVLRVGMAVVFLWFGFHQLFDPASWTVYVPSVLTHLPFSSTTIILLNGWLEVCGALLLITGFWLRPVAAILGIHMLFIAFEVGGAVGVRDFGLTVACVSIALSLPDSYTLDAYFAKTPIAP